MRLACIFPAFRMRYSHPDGIHLPGLPEATKALAARAAACVGLDAARLCAPAPGQDEDDLTAHYRCYVNSCAVAAVVRQHLGVGAWAAGYSMGLYAALCHSGALSFDAGLLLMRQTCLLSQALRAATDNSPGILPRAVPGRWPWALQPSPGSSHGMAALIGLTRAEVAALVVARELPVEVADICAERTVVAAGPHAALDQLLEQARDAGCLQARKMPVDLAYHSSQMQAVEPELRAYARGLDFRTPRCPLVSCVSQQLLTTPESLREEAAVNVTRPINWHATMQVLHRLGADTFVECGLSDSLSKLARALDGERHCFHPKNLSRLLSQDAPRDTPNPHPQLP